MLESVALQPKYPICFAMLDLSQSKKNLRGADYPPLPGPDNPAWGVKLWSVLALCLLLHIIGYGVALLLFLRVFFLLDLCVCSSPCYLSKCYSQVVPSQPRPSPVVPVLVISSLL